MTPDELIALARRLRAHAGTIRNPAAKAAMGDDIRAAANVIDGLTQPPQTVTGGPAAKAEEVAALGIDILTMAWLRFQALADTAPNDEIRAALGLAMRIANSLSNLRSEVSEVIIKTATDNFGVVDAARELRHAPAETAKVEG